MSSKRKSPLGGQGTSREGKSAGIALIRSGIWWDGFFYIINRTFILYNKDYGRKGNSSNTVKIINNKYLKEGTGMLMTIGIGFLGIVSLWAIISIACLARSEKKYQEVKNK